jgi:hypothetical protein
LVCSSLSIPISFSACLIFPIPMCLALCLITGPLIVAYKIARFINENLKKINY